MTGERKRRRSPSQSRSRETVDAICQAAVQVFGRLGYSTTTTKKIAERAGVSVGSLYQYYRDKDAIVLELWRRHTQVAHAELHEVLDDPNLSQQPVGELAHRLAKAVLSLHMVEPKIHLVFAERNAGGRALSREKKKEDARLIEKAAEQFSAHPDIATNSPLRAAMVVGQLLESLTHWYVLSRPPMTEEELLGELQRVIESYLSGLER